ncbi:nitrile hydratase [Methylobacterium sp. Leaf113]|uniref:nitrile hydratase accessory protein n=1 Tax=Methylobacterium sp. Leaf113 TaxID=1736259 RepID=UPI0006F8FDE9|nr:nitrile hydratase accessory protein [Methylobacterium sp. Leaf113]KQP89820.1 nitrile hydratase [Methylobacterium sp. Leaf113]
MRGPDRIPLDDAAAPVFAEPWEAQAFALVVALHDRGLFDWTEWAEALGAETRRTGQGADYAAWLATLEGLLAARGIAAPERLAERRDAFARAAAATPHGEPIRLANDPRAAAAQDREVGVAKRPGS